MYIQVFRYNMIIRKFIENDLSQLIMIWNEVVDQGISFPQEDLLDHKSGKDFFNSQTYVGVAVEENEVLGLYIMHPNNIGRCSHIANCSYAVKSSHRGRHIGRKLVCDSIEKSKDLGFLILQFNAVVETNHPARKLYENLGFKQLGTIPKGFRMNDGSYENICPYYIEL